MRHDSVHAPLALVTLSAYQPAPARVELVYRPLPGRLFRTLLALVVFWGMLPLLIWVPPHYPWVVCSFCAGLFLAYRQWHGRYEVRAFAGICPRCGNALSMGVDHTVSFPHTLTCYHCHFEPRLEVRFDPADAGRLEHRAPECVGLWEPRWLADEAFLVCGHCHSGARATPEVRAAAEAENQRAELLERLTREGRGIL